MDELVAWLLAAPPWVEYHTRLDLLDQPESDPRVQAARQAMLAHPLVQALLEELTEWPRPALKSHKAAGHPLHKLTFLADLGLRNSDPALQPVLRRVLAHRAAEGVFQILVNIAPRYGGRGEEQWAWMLCDAPLLVYAMAGFGLGHDERVRQAMRHLQSLLRENGWPCAATPELGGFRGPGRKADPCPYATLVMLKTIAQMPGWDGEEAARTGAEALLTLWQQRQERRPYLFAMGSGFAKLKAPLIWYDVLHVTDVLTRFPWLRQDERLREMVGIVAAAADESGRFTAGSVWRAWKGWSFGQKRTPSPWLTLLAQRVLKRYGAEM